MPACVGDYQREIIMTLYDLVERYCLLNVLRPASEACYRNTARVFLNRSLVGADADISVVTRDVLLRFRVDVLKNGSAVSWNTYRCHLRALFSFAVKEGLLPENPFAGIGIAPAAKGRRREISVADVGLVISHLQQSEDPMAEYWTALTHTLYYTGIRRAQLVALRWEDVDLRRKLLTLKAESSKTHREWQIPIRDELVPALELLAKQAMKVHPHGMLDSLARVFDWRPFGRSSILAPREITRFYHRLGKRLGLLISPHRFRHTVATTLANSSANLRVVQEILGHTAISTTCQYIHPNTAAMRAAIRLIHPIGELL